MRSILVPTAIGRSLPNKIHADIAAPDHAGGQASKAAAEAAVAVQNDMALVNVGFDEASPLSGDGTERWSVARIVSPASIIVIENGLGPFFARRAAASPNFAE